MKRSLLFFISAFLFSALFQSACRNFQIAQQGPGLLFTKSEISNSLSKYDVYVHGSNGVFKLENARVSGDTLFEKNSANPTAKDPSQHSQSIDIYSVGPIRSTYTAAKEKIILTKKEIQRVIFPGTLRSKEVAKGDDDTGIALGLLLLIIILSALILWLVIYLIVKSANQAANNNSSSNGSGSNSNTGTSSNGGGSSSGCYIATMVYGSYDAPQVMTLRRFRDEKLSRSAGGRAFIRWYYSWSPGFVQKYNHLNWLHKIIRVLLDGLVKLLS